MVKQTSNTEHREEMTQTEYAKYRGVSRVAVTKWKQKGLLVFTESGKIDVNQSNHNLHPVNNLGKSSVNKNVVVPVNKQHPQKTKRKSHPKPAVTDPEAIPDILDGLQALLDSADFVSEYKAKEIKENYLALLRKLEFEKKAGKLVEVEPLKKFLFELWRQERDALLNLPTRISAILAAELGIDQNRLTILLEKHLNEFLNERADQPLFRIG